MSIYNPEVFDQVAAMADDWSGLRFVLDALSELNRYAPKVSLRLETDVTVGLFATDEPLPLIKAIKVNLLYFVSLALP